MSETRITFTLPISLDTAEISLIKATINYFHGDKKAAANALGISLKTIYNKLERERDHATDRDRVSKESA